MPAWSADLATVFPGEPELQTQAAYRRWFLRLCGVLGDPVAAKARATANKDKGIRTTENPYSYKPAFKNRLSTHDLGLAQRVLMSVWNEVPAVLDPTAGGGSIPYEAMRMGFVVTANDLNPVAAGVLEASLSLPAAYGLSLREDLAKFGKVLVERTTERLNGFFPEGAGEKVTNYVFARTVSCPRTGKSVPLSPNWWLSRGDAPVAVRLHTRRNGQLLDRVEYEIVTGGDFAFDPDDGTVAGGDAISPWDGLAIDGEYIRAEAQAGRMGSELYAVAIRTAAGRGFRAPTRVDIDAIAAAERGLAAVQDDWLRDGILPTEAHVLAAPAARPRDLR
jgi:hypothetical protein